MSHVYQRRMVVVSTGTLLSKPAIWPTPLPYLSGTLGCAMSHIKLWEIAVAECRSITIFEDDVVVSTEFRRRAEEVLAALPSHWDIIHWGCLINPLFAWVDLGISKVKLVGYGEWQYKGETGAARFRAEAHAAAPVKLLHSFGLQGYSISPQGAKAALDYCLPLRRRLIEFPDAEVVTEDSGLDVALCGLYPTIQAFVCLPPLVIHADEEASERVAVDTQSLATEADRAAGYREEQSASLGVAIFVHPGMTTFLASLVRMLIQGLLEIGRPCEVLHELPTTFDRQLLIVGATLLDKRERQILPEGSIVLNVENTSSPFVTDDYITFLKRVTVWDYDIRNSQDLCRILEKPVYHFKMFYVAALSRVVSAPESDIDVLFFGSFNDRRSHILDTLRARGLSVVARFGVFNQELDDLIARSKVVLNIHYHENGRMEMVRLFDLLANSRAVVTELNDGEALDPDLADALVAVPYAQLAAATEALVLDEGRRRSVARKGFEAFGRRTARDILSPALAWSTEHAA